MTSENDARCGNTQLNAFNGYSLILWFREKVQKLIQSPVNFISVPAQSEVQKSN